MMNLNGECMGFEGKLYLRQIKSGEKNRSFRLEPLGVLSISAEIFPLKICFCLFLAVVAVVMVVVKPQNGISL